MPSALASMLPLTGLRAAQAGAGASLRLPGVSTDPYAILARGARRRRQAPEEELTPEEERSLLGSALGLATYVGEALDKPGAAVRGLLATGDPAQLLHAIPFSGALGFAPKKKVWGRELLEQAGMLGRNRPGFDWGDVAGFGAEVALDPLLWMTGPLGTISRAAQAGAKGAKGLAAARVGLKATQEAVKAGKLTGLGRVLKTPAGVAEQILAGERGLWGLRVPFTRQPFVSFGEGSKVGAWAIEKMFYGGGRANPLMWMRGLFSHSAGAKNLPEFFAKNPGALQRAKDIAFAGTQLVQDAVADTVPGVARVEAELVRLFRQIADHHKVQGDLDTFNAFSRSMLELERQIPRGEELLKRLRSHLALPADAALDDIVDDAGRMAEDFYQYLDTTLALQDPIFERAVRLGAPTGLLHDIYGRHAARRPSVPGLLMPAARVASAGFAAWISRRDWLRHMPGMTATVNALAREPMLTATKGLKGPTAKKVRGQLAKALSDLGVTDIPNKLGQRQELYAWKKFIEPEFEQFWKTAKVDDAGQLVDDAGEVVSRKYGAGRMPVTYQSERDWWLEPRFRAEVSQSGRTAQMAPRPSHLRTVVNRLRELPEQVREKGIFDRTVLEDVLEYQKDVANWTSTFSSLHRFLGSKGVVHLAKDDPSGVPLEEIWRAVKVGRGRQGGRGLNREGLETFVREHFPDQVGENIDDAIGQLRVAEGVRNVVQNYVEVLRPDRQATWTRYIDRINGLFRGWLFTAWPAAHSRNLGSGFFQSLTDGRVGFIELLEGYLAAARHMARGEPLGVEYLLKHSDVLKGTGPMVEIAGREAAAEIPGIPRLAAGQGFLGYLAEPFRPSRMREKGYRTALSPFATRGFQEVTPEMARRGVRPPQSAWMEAGERTYGVVEFLNRAGYAEALHRKGFAPSEIIDLVKRSQFDYGQLSVFEKSVMRRAALFYCVDEQTECLSVNGWRKWDELQPGEMVFTVNMETHALELQPANEVAVFDYEGDMVAVQGRNIDALVTPNHRCIRLTQKDPTWRIREAEDLTKSDYLPIATEGWAGAEQPTYSDDFVALLGWIICEGSYRDRNVTVITQSPNGHASTVRGLLERLGIKHAENVKNPCIDFVIHTKGTHQIREVLPRKELGLEFLLKLTRSQLQLLYRTMLDGDGHHDWKDTTFYQANETTARNFQILATLLGKATRASLRTKFSAGHLGTKPIWEIRCKRVRKICRAHANYSHVSYKGKVWCPSTENGTVIVRRNGRVYPTGQTWPRKNTPYTLAKILERPGGRTAQAIRATRLLRGGDDEYMPSFLEETTGVRTGGTPEEAHYIWQSGLPTDELNRIALTRGWLGPRPGLRTLEKGAAQLHPLLMLVPELYAGRQMYTGRETKGLFSPTERYLGRRVPAVDRTLHYSPFSRAGRELMGMIDTRKSRLQRAMNALTGLKTGTYDIERQREFDLRRAIERQLESEPYVSEFKKPYIPAALKEKAGEEALEKLRHYEVVSRRIRGLREKRAAREAE